MDIIVPKSRRSNLIHLAHDKTGHLGYKKVISIIKPSKLGTLTLTVNHVRFVRRIIRGDRGK